MNIGSAAATLPRRTANYKPNIWNYDHLHSLTTKYHEELEEHLREAETLKDQVCSEFGVLKDPLQKLELIDWIDKLALSHYFEEEISKSVKEMAYAHSTSLSMDAHLYSAALYFRILRQHGYHVSQDGILELLDGEEKLVAQWDDEKARAEIFEASHLGVEGECTFDQKLNDDVGKNKYSCHRNVRWFNVRRYMHEINNKSVIHRLAGLSFNTIQVQHQNDLKDILRWWRNLGLLEVLTFSRDRVVESFLWAVGVAYEPQHGSLRKWLTKAILLVLIIDDVYDIYGSMDELEQFTTAVERWDPSEIEQLPEAIKRCFWMLYDTANDIDREIQKEKGWTSVLPHLKKVWIGFCKALLVEAKWYWMGESPSLVKYLENGWISSSGPVLSLHVLLGVGRGMDEAVAAFDTNQDIIHHASLIIRLCNDQGTSKAEVERGDSPSSILCHMREANVREEEARAHIGKLISDSWMRMNGALMRCPRPQQSMMRYIVNTARVANFIYQNGDGFGVQDRDTKNQVLSCLIKPLHLSQ
ncbi:alpha-farnesene synthase-like [Salvia miltiorrhiza]|uniref:alpha-farnesene synthase-like n=1 Tax=Salvia miltiorrhiza TaxID=226208 RepID=UPI0025AB5DDC|nr:alpha-farnesene synthase-like [Salvia miltiorrhiza]